MSANSVLDSFIKTYTHPTDGTYTYPTLVRHKGTVIAFAMDDQRRIYYTVLSPDSLSSDPNTFSGGWSNAPTELIFPTEIAKVGFGSAKPRMMPVFERNVDTPKLPGTQLPPFDSKSKESQRYDYFRSTTARLTAEAPFQVLSDGQYLYVFRQALAAPMVSSNSVTVEFQGLVFTDSSGNMITSQAGTSDTLGYTDKNNKWNPITWSKPSQKDLFPLVNATLLVDRFMLVGSQQNGSSGSATPRLEGKLEVRYQRSRKKESPQDRKDTLGAKDLDGNLFYEPTQELEFIGYLEDGRFMVLLVPTQVANISRWQIFTYSSATKLLNSFNIEQSPDGLFNTRGSQNAIHTVTGGTLYLGAAGYVKLNFPLQLTNVSFSLEAWIRPDKSDNLNNTQSLFNTSVIDKGVDKVKTINQNRESPDYGPSVWLLGDKKLCIGMGDEGKWYEHTSPELLKGDTWNHIAVTFDGKT